MAEDSEADEKSSIGTDASKSGTSKSGKSKTKRPGVPDHAVDAEPGFDSFGAIASMIAGPSGAAAGGLETSVKDRSKKKAGKR